MACPHSPDRIKLLHNLVVCFCLTLYQGWPLQQLYAKTTARQRLPSLTSVEELSVPKRGKKYHVALMHPLPIIIVTLYDFFLVEYQWEQHVTSADQLTTTLMALPALLPGKQQEAQHIALRRPLPTTTVELSLILPV